MFHHCLRVGPLCLCLPTSLSVSTNRHGYDEMIVFILPELTKFLDYINLGVFFKASCCLNAFCLPEWVTPSPCLNLLLRFHEVSSWWIHKSELQLSPCFFSFFFLCVFHIKKHSTSFSYWWMVEINRRVPARHLGVTGLPPRLQESFLRRSDLSETNGWFTVQQTKKGLFQNGKHHSTSHPERLFFLCLSEIPAIDVHAETLKHRFLWRGKVRAWGWHPSLGAVRGCGPAPVLFLLRSHFQAFPHWGF